MYTVLYYSYLTNISIHFILLNGCCGIVVGCGDVVVGHGGIVFEGNGGIVVGSGTPGNVVPCRLWEHKYFMKENKTSGRRSKSRDRQRQRAEGSSYKIMVRTFHSFQFQENE